MVALAAGTAVARLLPLLCATAPSACDRLARPAMVATSVAPNIRSRTRDAAVSDDAMRWYLSSISTRRLLDNAEEIRLAGAVKELLRWLSVRRDFMTEHGRYPARHEWAAAVGGNFSESAEGLRRFDAQLRILELAKDRMITSNLRLVVSIAKKYANRGVNIQDLIQEGSIGLMTAVDKFDPEHNCRFSTYAHYWIKQAVTRALADHSRAIRLPVHMNDCVNSIRRSRSAFYLANGCEPSEEELAKSLQISEAKLRLALNSARELISLEAPCFASSHQSDDKAWLDMIPDEGPKPEASLETTMLQDQIHRSLLSALLPLEREILCLRYGLEGRDRRTFEEIGLIFDLPKERVRQIEARALRKLRRPQQQRNLKAFDTQRQYV